MFAFSNLMRLVNHLSHEMTPCCPNIHCCFCFNDVTIEQKVNVSCGANQTLLVFCHIINNLFSQFFLVFASHLAICVVVVNFLLALCLWIWFGRSKHFVGNGQRTMDSSPHFLSSRVSSRMHQQSNLSLEPPIRFSF